MASATTTRRTRARLLALVLFLAASSTPARAADLSTARWDDDAPWAEPKPPLVPGECDEASELELARWGFGGRPPYEPPPPPPATPGAYSCKTYRDRGYDDAATATIDPRGTWWGARPLVKVGCDQRFDGGGWTLLLSQTDPTADFPGATNPFAVDVGEAEDAMTNHTTYARNWAYSFRPQPGDEFVIRRIPRGGAFANASAALQTGDGGDHVRFVVEAFCAGMDWNATGGCGTGSSQHIIAMGRSYDANGNEIADANTLNTCTKAGCVAPGGDTVGISQHPRYPDASGSKKCFGGCYNGGIINFHWGTAPDSKLTPGDWTFQVFFREGPSFIGAGVCVETNATALNALDAAWYTGLPEHAVVAATELLGVDGGVALCHPDASTAATCERVAAKIPGARFVSFGNYATCDGMHEFDQFGIQHDLASSRPCVVTTTCAAMNVSEPLVVKGVGRAIAFKAFALDKTSDVEGGPWIHPSCESGATNKTIDGYDTFADWGVSSPTAGTGIASAADWAAFRCDEDPDNDPYDKNVSAKLAMDGSRFSGQAATSGGRMYGNVQFDNTDPGCVAAFYALGDQYRDGFLVNAQGERNLFPAPERRHGLLSVGTGNYPTAFVRSCGYNSSRTWPPPPCPEDFHVQDNACAACPVGAVNPPGDDWSGPNTSCGCPADHHVLDHACVPCNGTSSRPPGDDPHQGDTSCSCAADHYVLDHACVPCPFGSTSPQGGDIYGEDTFCDSSCDSKSEWRTVGREEIADMVPASANASTFFTTSLSDDGSIVAI